MPNQSYLNLEDELEDRDTNPYSSITDREPLEDLSPGGMADDMEEDDADLGSPLPLHPAVKNHIQQKMAAKAAAVPVPSSDEEKDAPVDKNDYTQDPLMQQYLAKEKDLQNFRQAQLGANGIANFGQAAAQAAQGANAPVQDNALFKNIQEQGKEMLKSNEEDVDRRQKVINAIEQRKSREGIASDNRASRESTARSNLSARQAMMKIAQDRFDAANQTRKDRLDSTNIGRASALLSNPNISRETTKLNAARSAQSLIDGINTGEIKGSKNIRNQLTNIIATIELGSAGGEGDRQAMGINNLYTKAKDALSYLDSSPEDTIPPKYMTQLETESHALGDRAAKNYKALSDSILSGADLSGGVPDADPGKIHQLIKQRRDMFLNGNGYNPDTGEKLGKPKESAFPKQIKREGQIATVNSPEELREAMGEGWN